uniref:ABC-type spermidine/putrescine transport system, permease component I n=1 Tax=Eubacterium cellulosolvens (strain ATCC 43171 / JCM 9499 / 6) TaxID=633697 RepID=I5AUA7_EUBC6
MSFSRKSLGIIYAMFLILFVVAPLLVLFYFAFTNGQGQFTLSNFVGFFTDPNTLGTLFYSFTVAIVTTIVCLLLAYPTAYFLATSRIKAKTVTIMIFVMPMWINFSLRITALKEILTLIEKNLALYPFLNAVIGMTYDFLPFMILPIYTVIARLDGALREAAMDLGADGWRTFLTVTLPLSVPGIISGVSMVFLPAMTNYVVLDMLYNSTYIMGSLISSYFAAYDWHGGSMIALILLAIICLFTLLTGDDEEKNRGGALL